MTYAFIYDNPSAPRWEKSFTAESGETFSVALVFENKEDRLQLTSSQVYQHMENMLQYVKDKTAYLSLIQLNEEPPQSFWPVHGEYDEIESVMQEIQKWWNWAYYNDDFDTEAS